MDPKVHEILGLLLEYALDLFVKDYCFLVLIEKYLIHTLLLLIFGFDDVHSLISLLQLFFYFLMIVIENLLRFLFCSIKEVFLNLIETLLDPFLHVFVILIDSCILLVKSCRNQFFGLVKVSLDLVVKLPTSSFQVSEHGLQLLLVSFRRLLN